MIFAPRWRSNDVMLFTCCCPQVLVLQESKRQMRAFMALSCFLVEDKRIQSLAQSPSVTLIESLLLHN